jgi:2-(3-amino-3-carboxypropyl)histidine synthase
VKQYKKIALVASVQHVHQLPHVKELLEQEGMQVTIPKAMGRVHHAGQILGCEYSGPKMVEEDIDAYLALTNQFHALGLKLSTVKPLWMFDPVLERVENLQETREKMLRKRIMMVEKAKDARSFGILISTKSGQINKDLAENLKKKIESHQKEAMVITMKEIQPDELLNFATVDVFVSTACPRVAVEDQPRFGKPIITTVELLVALGEISWDELLKKGFITAPSGAK